MDLYTATEESYKNGFEDGLKAASRKGHWIHFDPSNLDRLECSECGCRYEKLHPAAYCSCCGSKNRVGGVSNAS